MSGKFRHHLGTCLVTGLFAASLKDYDRPTDCFSLCVLFSGFGQFVMLNKFLAQISA